MAKVGRNERCGCGSGRKVKRCCDVWRGPSEAHLAKAALALHERQAVRLLVGWSRAEFDAAWEEALELPDRDLSLLAPLPGLWGPALERLRAALQRDDLDAIDDALPAVLAEFDTPVLRLRLAEAALALADRGRIDHELAAVAVVMLASESTALVSSSVVQAVAVAVGSVATPSGLLVAGR